MESWRGAKETRSMIVLSLLREIHRSYVHLRGTRCSRWSGRIIFEKLSRARGKPRAMQRRAWKFCAGGQARQKEKRLNQRNILGESVKYLLAAARDCIRVNCSFGIDPLERLERVRDRERDNVRNFQRRRVQILSTAQHRLRFGGGLLPSQRLCGFEYSKQSSVMRPWTNARRYARRVRAGCANRDITSR